MPEDKELRGKIVLELSKDHLPVVKFFGEIKPMDIQYSKLAIQKNYRIYINKLGKAEVAKQKQVELDKLEEDRIMAEKAHKEQVDKEIEKLKKEQEKLANKEKDKDNESGAIESIKTGSGDTKASGYSSRSSSGSRSSGTLQAN